MKTAALHMRFFLTGAVLLATCQGALAQAQQATPAPETGAEMLAPALMTALVAMDRRQAAQLHRSPNARVKAVLAAYLLAMRAGCMPGQRQGAVPAAQADLIRNNNGF